MNKFWTVIFAILGGVERVIYIITPIILGTLFLSLGTASFGQYLIFYLGLLATLFRGIKVGFPELLG